VCEGRGGRIYAADECFLEEAQQVIRDAHGAHVVLRKPEVHSYLDPALDAWVEPVMFLRIKTPHAYAREILAELHCRRARILEEDVQRYDLVIRAEGPLVHLLGLTRVIASVTRNSAAIWTWLDRYERAMTTPSIRSRTLDPNGPLEDPPSTDASPAARC
jgi:translation elongation factor EF-G